MRGIARQGKARQGKARSSGYGDLYRELPPGRMTDHDIESVSLHKRLETDTEGAMATRMIGDKNDIIADVFLVNYSYPF